jgi:hypothetical protein
MFEPIEHHPLCQFGQPKDQTQLHVCSCHFLPEEPVFSVNGHVLTTAQSMTMRVALNNFLMDLQEDVESNGPIEELYIERVREIQKLM